MVRYANLDKATELSLRLLIEIMGSIPIRTTIVLNYQLNSPHQQGDVGRCKQVVGVTNCTCRKPPLG